MLTRMRLGILPFFVAAAFVVWFWARRYFGGAVAALATGMFTLVPTVLAHGGLATTDMPLTACLSAAFFALLVWAEAPTWQHSVLLGATTALAVVSKFTALGYLPAAAALCVPGVSDRRAPRQWVVVCPPPKRAPCPLPLRCSRAPSASGPSTPSHSAK